MKICRAGAELFRAYGRTDEHKEANNRFSQICEPALKYFIPVSLHILLVLIVFCICSDVTCCMTVRTRMCLSTTNWGAYGTVVGNK